MKKITKKSRYVKVIATQEDLEAIAVFSPVSETILNEIMEISVFNKYYDNVRNEYYSEVKFLKDLKPGGYTLKNSWLTDVKHL